MSQKEFIGIGCINNVKEIIEQTHANKILLVTGKKSYARCNAKSCIDDILSNKYTEQFNQFDVNPKLDDVYCGVQLLKGTKFDLVIAVGGGSVIDMAKTINILAVQSDDNLVKYINDSTLITEKGLPLVAIPTTVGSGSEATHFSVVYMDYKKHSLSHIFMLPNYVIVDAELSYNIPQHILASSGIDALSQAVESYWAVKSTDKSKNFASKAIVLTLDALHDAVEGDERAIVKMSKASNLAGKAINITTTTAPHAISYSITTNFGISHGHAVALTLGKFFEINYNASASSINDPRGLDYLNKTMNEIFAMFGVSSHLECSREWYRIMIKINLEHNFKNIGIKTDIDIEKIVNHVDLLRIKNNPVLLNKSRIRKIFV